MNTNLNKKKYIHICNHIELENKMKNEIISQFKDTSIIEIDCYNCKNKEGLMLEMCKKLKFPSYFSHNWDSFDECINNLEWLEFSSLIIILKQAEHLLSEEVYNMIDFYDIISTSVDEWNDGITFNGEEIVNKPFYVFFITDNVDLFKNKLKKFL